MLTTEEMAEVKRLHFGELWPIGTIATHLQRHPDAVKRVIETGSFVREERVVRKKGDGYESFIEDTLKRYPGINATRVHEMLRIRGYTGKPRTTRRLVERLRPEQTHECFLRRRTLKGEEAQTDWGKFGTIQVGRAKRPLSLFLMVLSWSRAMFGVFTLNERMDTFLRCHTMAFGHFGGVARVNLYDNLKSAVISRIGHVIHFNPRHLEMAGHYRFEPRPVAVARGNEKGRVERKFRYIRESFFIGRTFRDIDDLNVQFAHWNQHTASQLPCPEDNGLTVAESLAEEREVLLSLPSSPFQVDTPEAVRSGKTPYIRFDLNDYSIPHHLVRKPLTLVATDKEVRIIDGMKEVACHRRSYDRHAVIEDERHIEALAKAKKEARQSRGLNRLFQAVPDSQAFLERVLERHYDLPSATKQLEHLLDTYGAEELHSAIAHANHHELSAPSSVAQWLDQERRKRHMKPLIAGPITNDPRVRDLHVIPHKLEAYNDLARNTSVEE